MRTFILIAAVAVVAVVGLQPTVIGGC